MKIVYLKKRIHLNNSYWSLSDIKSKQIQIYQKLLLTDSFENMDTNAKWLQKNFDAHLKRSNL